jgi:hypothetical protein
MHSAPPKTSPGAQNMKTGPDALGTAEKEFGAENIKKGPDALDTVENESGSAKHQNGTRRPRYRRKRIWERKTCKRDPMPSVPSKTSPAAQIMKMGHDALCTVEN